MNILITICARGGSKGLPGKNIKNLSGKPLIAYSIEVAKAFAKDFPNSQISLSTDSNEIKDVASTFGLYTDYTRPDYLAGDSTGKVDVIRHILEFEENRGQCNYHYILDLDVSAPLRNLGDLQAAFKILLSDSDALNLFSVSKPHKNPYFNMVELKENGYYSLVKDRPEKLLTRQSAPQVFDINASFYVYTRRFFELGFSSVITEKAKIYECEHICFDLDNPVDFDIMEFLLTNNKLDFQL